MKKSFLNKILIPIIVLISTIIISLVFALSNSWDLNTPSEYSIDIPTTQITGGVGKLKYQLNHLGSIRDGAGFIPYLTRPEAIVLKGNYAFITGRSNALEVIDVTDPALPLHTGALLTGFGGLPLNRPTDMVGSGNLLYIANSRGGSVEIIDITNPALPINVGNIITGFGAVPLARPTGLTLSGNLLFIADNRGGLAGGGDIEIVNIANPLLPINIGSIEDPAGIRMQRPNAIEISGNYAYVVGRSNALDIINITNPALPIMAGQLIDGAGLAPFLNRPVDLAIKGNYAYIVGRSAALEVVNITNPLLPIHAGSLLAGLGLTGPFLTSPTEILIDGNTAYITDPASNAIQLVDISNPLIPAADASATGTLIKLLGGANTIAKSGSTIYVGSNVDNALEILGRGYPIPNSIALALSPPPATLQYIHTGSIIDGLGLAPFLTSPNSMILKGNYAYIIGRSNALEIVNVTNPALPIHAGSLLTGFGGIPFNRPTDMVGSGNLLYIANGRGGSVEIVDVTNPLLPLNVGNIITGFGATPLARPEGLFLSGNLLYITDSRGGLAGGGSIEIVDITNPILPLNISSFEDPAGIAIQRPTSIKVIGNYAYIGGRGTFDILNITNPLLPILGGQLIDGGGVAPFLAGPLKIAIKGNYAYVTDNGSAALEIINISNPLFPVHAGAMLDGGGIAPFLAAPTDILIDGDIAYITDNGSNAVQLININNPGFPTVNSSIIGTLTTLLGGANTIAKSGSLLFVGSNIDNALEILAKGYAPTPPPTLNILHTGSIVDGLGLAPFLTSPSAVVIKGNYAYVTGRSNALEVVDISNAALPVHAGSLLTGFGGIPFNRPTDIVGSGNLLYIANGRGGSVEIVDVTNPLLPLNLGNIITGFGATPLTRPEGLFLSGNLLYIADSRGGLAGGGSIEIVNVTNPLLPLNISSFEDPAGIAIQRPTSIKIVGNYAYIGGRGTFDVLNITNPALPLIGGQLIDGGGLPPFLAGPLNMDIKGNYAYITDNGSAALEIINITNPLLPVHAGSILDGGGLAPFLAAPAGIVVDGDIAYIADNGSNAVQLINIANPAFPTANSSIIGTPTTLLGGANTITKSGSLIYVGSNIDNALEILYTTTGAIGPVGTSPLIYMTGILLLNTPVSITVNGQYAYVADKTPGINIYDISNPKIPFLASTLPLLNRPVATAQSGGLFFMASKKPNSFDIYDVSKPLLPIVPLGTLPLLYKPKGMYLDAKNSMAYVYGKAKPPGGGRAGFIDMINVANPLLPVLVGTILDPTLRSILDIAVDGTGIYIVGEDINKIGFIQKVDITNPLLPVMGLPLIDGAGLPPYLMKPLRIKLQNNLAYVLAEKSNALEIIDISNPLLLVHTGALLGSITPGIPPLINKSKDMFLEGNTAYIVSKNDNALQLVDISNPNLPKASWFMTGSLTRLIMQPEIVEKRGPLIYVGSKGSLTFSIIYETPPSTGGEPVTVSNTDPHIINNNSLVYSGTIDLLTSTPGPGNAGIIKYQISKDGGNTWYYLSGSTRQQTTSGAIASSSPGEINYNIQSFNNLPGGTGDFKWQAFLISDGTKQVELDNVAVDFTSFITASGGIIDFEQPGQAYTVPFGTFTRTLTNPQEGLYSIESGNHSNNSFSCLQVDKNIIAASKLKFWKSVSSEANWDNLRFYIDGTQIAQWSGLVPWSQEIYDVTNGNHAFKWCYEKDASTSSGSDMAWVDYIEVVQTPPTTGVTVLDFEIPGGYTGTTAATIPGPDWIRVLTDKYEGLYSLESQNRLNTSTGCFQRVQTVSPLDTGISFWKKVSSEPNWDFLTFSINGILQNKWSGNIPWSNEVYNLPPATYTLDWCYTKDALAFGGLDRAWIDLVTVTQAPPVISEVTPILTPTNNNTPSYTFNTPLAGTISYTGSCSSATSNATIGNNTIIFNSLADGIYTNCNLQVLASPQNSTTLHISNFTIDTTRINTTINYPINTSTIANKSFDMDISYFDINGVNTGSIILGLYKFNTASGSYGSDIGGSFIDFTGAIVGSTGAIYHTSQLGDGQYKIIFEIKDTTGNNSITSSIFTINKAPLTLTTTTNTSGGGVFNYSFNILNTSINNITSWVIGFQLDGGTITTSSGANFANALNLFNITSNSLTTDTFLPGGTTNVTFSGTGNGVITDLYLKSYVNASPQVPVDYFLTQNTLDVNVTTTSITGNTYCRNIALTNTGTQDITNWGLSFDLNQNLTTTSSGTFSKAGITHSISPLGNAIIPVGTTTNVGFCSNGLNADNNWLITGVTLSLGDIISPTISSSSPADASIQTTGTFNFVYNYSDNVGGSGIDTTSDQIFLYKWDPITSTYGPDIASTNMFLGSKIVTTTTATYPSNNIIDGQYKAVFKIFDLNNNFTTSATVFTVGIPPADTTAPIITSSNPTNNKLMPYGIFNLKFNYSDELGGSGIDTLSDTIALYKWDSVNNIWSANIASSELNLGAKTVSIFQSIYPTNNLAFGKYKANFNISDIAGNIGAYSVTFYKDTPELIINTGSLDMGTLNFGVNNFSPLDFILTVKTVGAPFDVLLNKTSAFTNGTAQITDWNGTKGVGYDKAPYTSTIKLINPNEIIASNTGGINTGGNKNIYLYNVKIGTLINQDQPAGQYNMGISFGINLSY